MPRGPPAPAAQNHVTRRNVARMRAAANLRKKKEACDRVDTIDEMPPELRRMQRQRLAEREMGPLLETLCKLLVEPYTINCIAALWNRSFLSSVPDLSMHVERFLRYILLANTSLEVFVSDSSTFTSLVLFDENLKDTDESINILVSDAHQNGQRRVYSRNFGANDVIASMLAPPVDRHDACMSSLAIDLGEVPITLRMSIAKVLTVRNIFIKSTHTDGGRRGIHYTDFRFNRLLDEALHCVGFKQKMVEATLFSILFAFSCSQRGAEAVKAIVGALQNIQSSLYLLFPERRHPVLPVEPTKQHNRDTFTAGQLLQIYNDKKQHQLLLRKFELFSVCDFMFGLLHDGHGLADAVMAHRVVHITASHDYMSATHSESEYVEIMQSVAKHLQQIHIQKLHGGGSGRDCDNEENEIRTATTARQIMYDNAHKLLKL